MLRSIEEITKLRTVDMGAYQALNAFEEIMWALAIHTVFEWGHEDD